MPNLKIQLTNEEVNRYMLACDIDKANAEKYSWHSFESFNACCDILKANKLTGMPVIVTVTDIDGFYNLYESSYCSEDEPTTVGWRK